MQDFLLLLKGDVNVPSKMMGGETAVIIAIIYWAININVEEAFIRVWVFIKCIL